MSKKSPQLSVIIPAYNEAKTLPLVLKAVKAAKPRSKEVIVVNDGSSDDTKKILRKHKQLVHKVIHHQKNQGKGAAIHSGIKVATGQMIIIQDADLEYDPADLERLIQPIVEDKADVVYGSRFIGGQPHRVLYFWHFVANKCLTWFSNIVTNVNLSDMETGYKVFRAEVLKNIKLNERDFGFEPEVTIKVCRQNLRIYEMGIGYFGRSYEDGKKIGFMDAIKAVWLIFKYGVIKS